jgi:multiple antibiotic resistance protein
VVPIFIAMTHGDSKEELRDTARRAALVAAALLVFFALFGTFLFKVVGVSLSAFRVAGGIVLLITALDMLRARQSETRTSPEEAQEATAKEDVAIVPLAIPLLAGPGAIATVMVLMSRAAGVVSVVAVVASIVVTMATSYFLLRGASLVQRFLGQSGVAILQRVMGLLLAAIAVQFIAEGGRDLVGLGPHPG